MRSVTFREKPALQTAEEFSQRRSERTSTKALWWIVEQALLVFGSWTLGMHFCVYAGVPAWSLYVAFAVIYAVLLLLARPKLREAVQGVRRSPWLAGATLSISALLALYAVFSFRTHVEDVLLFHRPLVQIERLDEPILMENTQYNERGLPLYTTMHALTSVELFSGFLAHAVGGDPLWFCLHTGPIGAMVLLPIVYVLLFRRFRLGPVLAVAATCGVVLFLFNDHSIGRSFGCYALMQMQMGKATLFTIMIPLTFLQTLRCLAGPRPRRFLLLFLCGVCAAGFSGSGIFIIPLLIFFTSGAYALAYGFRWRRWKKSILVNTGSLYCVGIALCLIAGILEPPRDTLVWDSFEPDWWKNLNYVLMGPRTTFRNAVLLVLVPLAGLRWRYSRFLLLYLALWICCIANPITGPEIIKLLKPGAYSRVVYLLPVPLCAGLLVKCLPVRGWQREATWRLLHRGRTLLNLALAVISMSFSWLKFAIGQVATSPVGQYLFPRFDVARLRERFGGIRAGDVTLLRGDRRIFFRLVVLLTAVLAGRVAVTLSVWDRMQFKSATAYSLPVREASMVQEMSPYIDKGANVLAPIDIQLVLGLLRPDVQFEAEEGLRTIHVYRNVEPRDEDHDPTAEGIARTVAVAAVTQQVDGLGGLTGRILLDQSMNQAFAAALGHGVNVVIVNARRQRWVEKRLAAHRVQWEAVWKGQGVAVLMLERSDDEIAQPPVLAPSFGSTQSRHPD